MTVTSGRKCSELLQSSGPIGLLEKMLLESSVWRSTRCLLTWKTRVTPQGRLLFRLAPSTPRTAETDAPLWPTPAARDCKGANSMEHLIRGGRRNHIDQLPNAVKLWPTPSARLDAVAALFPTPTKFDAECGDLKGKEYNGKTRHAMKLIQAAKMFPTPTTGAVLCGGSGSYRKLKALESAGKITEEERRNMAQGSGGQLNPGWVEWLMGFPTGWTEV